MHLFIEDMEAKRLLRAVAMNPAVKLKPDDVYALVLRATGREAAAQKAMSQVIDAELRAGNTPEG